MEKEKKFLLIGIIPQAIEKAKKYSFVHRASKYKLIGDVLYMQGADLVLRRVPWKEELYKFLEENLEGACGGHFAFKITLQRFCKKGMCGLVCRKIFTIGVGLAKDANNLGREF